MTAIGERAGVLLSQDADVLTVIGFGRYVGDEVPESAVGPLAEFAKRAGRVNPKIELDSGEVAWGCEVWWGTEEKVRSVIQRHEESGGAVRTVTMASVRDVYRERAANPEGT